VRTKHTKKKVHAYTKYKSIAKFGRKITMEKLNEQEKDTFTQLLAEFEVEPLKPDDDWKNLYGMRNDLCK